MPATTVTSPTNQLFDVNTLRRLSTAGSGSGSGSASATNGTTFSTDDGPELKDDPAHRQDWSKTTAPDETWAIRERRRQSMWSKAEMPVIVPKKTGGARHGSVLSVWVSGKDKDGNDILVHDSGDEAQEELDNLADGNPEGKKVVVIEEDPSEEVKKLRQELLEMKAKLARLQPEEIKDDGEFLLVKPADVTGETERRKSRGSRGSRGSAGGPVPTERRGSILSLWAQGTDKQGNPVIMHRDDEWKKEDEDVIIEEKEPVNGKV